VLETGKSIDLIEEHQPIGESKFYVQVIKTPLYDSNGKTAGTLGIFWDITERRQAEIELKYMKDSLNAANIELQAALVREQQLARTDSLTGVNTRRHLLELAAHEFNIAMRYRPPLSVLMFDIDSFKHINDTFGHAIGDLVLQRIIQTVCTEIRSADMVGRYGGDEFIILLPQTSTQEVLPLAERISEKVTALSIETDKGPLAVSLSIGITQTVHEGMSDPGYEPDTVENLLLRADRALYAAKQAGRNCIMIIT
jgi:diguanylate cyclase (GGDEF)-like protein